MSQAAANTYLFEEMPVRKAVLTMAIPTITSQLIVLFYNMADTFFVGRTKDPYMVAAASLILPVFNICLSISGLAGIGGGSLISRLLGNRESNEARRVYSFSLVLAFCMAAAFSLLTLIFLSPLVNFLGADEGIAPYARQYALCVIVLGGIPTILSNTLSHLIRSTGESARSGLGLTMGAILNIILDPLFMFVLMPRGMEIAGAGLATCLSNVIVLIYFILVIGRMDDDFILKNPSFRALPSGTSIKKIFSVGIPNALNVFLFDLDYIVIGRLMTAYGAIQMAAVGIVLKVERLPLNTGIGICQGMMPLVTYNYSSKDHKRMNGIIRFSLIFGLTVSFISIALYEVFSPQIMSIFINEAATVAIGSDFLRIRILATPFMFMSFFTVHVFNSFGEGRTSFMLGFTRWAILNIPMLFIMNRIIGMYGIVWSQLLADMINVSLSFCVYLRYIRKKANA